MAAEGLGREPGRTGWPRRRRRPAGRTRAETREQNVLRHVGVYTNARHSGSARLWLYRRRPPLASLRYIDGPQVPAGGSGGGVRYGGTEYFILFPDINSGPDLAYGRLC